MYSFEPGPIVLVDFPVAPAIFTPHRAEALAAPYVGFLDGADAAIGAQRDTIAPLASTDLTGQYNAEVPPAVDALAGIGLASDAADLAGAANAGANVGGSLDAQARDLPGPDEPPPDVGLDQGVEQEPNDIPPDEPPAPVNTDY